MVYEEFDPDELIEEFENAGSPDSYISWVATRAQITEAEIAGEECLKFSAIENVDSKRRPTIGIRLKALGLDASSVSELWISRLIFIPNDFKGYLIGGGQNWINLGSGILYMSITTPGEPWTSGGIQFYHSESRPGHLRFQGGYRKTVTGSKTHTGFHTTKNIPFGEWIEWITAIKYGLHDGRTRHWLKNELIYDFQNICTDPQPQVGGKAEYYTPRFYLGIPINTPQHIYQTEFILSDEPLNGDGGPEPEPEPEPKKTLAAEMLPFPILLNKLWQIRKKVFTKEQHRKLHPLI